jgi:acetate CoA/acetoacetate CoA-transferase alpha subunit
VALVAARRADYNGNLEYTLTARNFNPLMAMAATTTIAEAEDIVPVGMIPPDAVVTPGVLSTSSSAGSHGRDGEGGHRPTRCT